VVLPFQILVCSLVFRTSSRLSDSLARASGIVYQRAWRQWIYAAAVVIGAYIGRTQGLVGVSIGTVMATVLNFVLMLRLSVRWLGISWPTVLQVYARHFAMAFGMTVATIAAADVARLWALPDPVVILAIFAASGLSWLLLLKVFPRLIGDDVDWAIDLVRQQLKCRSRTKG
jgi:PST family polysaccharide transporter